MKLLAVSGAVAALALTLLACSPGPGGVDGPQQTEQDDTAGARKRDAGNAPDGDASTDDGTPTRQPCTSSFGNGLAGTFGRLDGIIVAVVPPGHGACNADGRHVHLQVLAGGQTYDVAVNVDGGFFATRDAALPSVPWSDGWHGGGSLDYAQDLGLHAGDFATVSESTLEQDVEDALAKANHVSVFATLYSHGGVHLVHRRGNDSDGAVVLDPLSPAAHILAFRFSSQTF